MTGSHPRAGAMHVRLRADTSAFHAELQRHAEVAGGACERSRKGADEGMPVRAQPRCKRDSSEFPKQGYAA